MARPKKITVDYFPHQCHHGKTIFILEQRWGNDGYAFWFKVLELLGASEGHVIDCRNPGTWEFLQSKTNLSEDICTEILTMLAKLEAIDTELWENQIIWSKNFLHGIADVYRNRRVEIPPKPSFYTQKPKSDGVITPETSESTPNNPQTKGKETKGKETKLEKDLSTAEPPTPSFSVQDLAILWNENAPPELPKVHLPFKRPPKAMAKLREAIKRNHDRRWWERVLLKTHDSPFLLGVNDRGWKASIDFVVENSEVILDGKYDGGKKLQPKGWEALKESMQRRKSDAQ